MFWITVGLYRVNAAMVSTIRQASRAAGRRRGVDLQAAFSNASCAASQRCSALATSRSSRAFRFCSSAATEAGPNRSPGRRAWPRSSSRCPVRLASVFSASRPRLLERPPWLVGATGGRGLALLLFLSFLAVRSPLGRPALRSLQELRLVFVDVAVERLHRAAGDQPQLVGHHLHQMRIVAHQHDGALEIVDGIDQRVTRIHVEMVGRLVEQQHVRRVAGGERQQQAGLLAARQDADLEVGAIAREAEAAELGAHLGLAGARTERAVHVVERRRLVVEALFLILREVADAQLRRLLQPCPRAARAAARSGG